MPEASEGQPVRVSLEEIGALSAFSTLILQQAAAVLLSGSHASWFKLQIGFGGSEQ